MFFRRIGFSLSMLVVLAGLVGHQMGWLDGALLMKAGAVIALVAGLVGVVRLPWDLTFAARNALAQQEAARRRGLHVDDTELTFAKNSARRALWLAIALHLVGAGLAVLGTPLVGIELGVVLAVAFLGSMALRPIHAFYVHTQQRLMQGQRDAMVRPPDAHTLAAADEELKRRIEVLSEELEAERTATQGQLAVVEARTRDEASAWRTAVTETDQKMERVLREFERTVERTQQSAEVLAGIRSFVRLVRES